MKSTNSSAFYSLYRFSVLVVFVWVAICLPCKAQLGRVRMNINNDWRFMRYNGQPDELKYDDRPQVYDRKDDKVADDRATLTVNAATVSDKVLKTWILPTANDFISDPKKHHHRPAGNPGSDFAFVQAEFNDSSWKQLDLPHDCCISAANTVLLMHRGSSFW